MLGVQAIRSCKGKEVQGARGLPVLRKREALRVRSADFREKIYAAFLLRLARCYSCMHRHLRLPFFPAANVPKNAKCPSRTSGIDNHFPFHERMVFKSCQSQLTQTGSGTVPAFILPEAERGHCVTEERAKELTIEFLIWITGTPKTIVVTEAFTSATRRQWLRRG